MKTPQSAAIPYRRNSARELEVLLVTSRRRSRWVLPKGTIKRMLPHAAAAREAFEEAGVLGVISRKPLGVYRQHKAVGDGQEIEVAVTAFPMFVNTLLGTWPEMGVRKRKWMLIGDAVDAVNDMELRSIIQSFGEAYWPGYPTD